MKWLYVIFAFCVILHMSGCHTTSGRRAPVLIPPGVDSLVAAVADSVVDSLFVSPEQQKEAEKLTGEGKQKMYRSDSLWNIIDSKRDSLKSVSDSEKERASDSKIEGARIIQEALDISTRANQIDSVNKELVRAEIVNLLEESQKLFEASLKDNPFDEETKIWLAKVYEMMANRFTNAKKYEKAVDVLNGLIRMNQGEPQLYFRLGMNYWFQKKWKEAHRNFKHAENLLINVTPLNFNETVTDSADLVARMNRIPVDTTQLFNYIYFQADTKAKLYEADAALDLLYRATKIAPTETEKEDILFYINWIKWDDGNIKASELNDYYAKLETSGDFEAAAKGFKKLLKVLKTERTKDQINWRISLLEFEHLNQFEEGIERLSQVIRKTAKDSIGAPVDTTYKRYFKDFGIMGYNMGIRNVGKQPKVAYMYFKQAVTIDCPIRGKSFLELAKLSVNNPREAVEMCHNALNFSEQLTVEEKSQAYRLLVEGYKRQGQIEKAKEYFIKWKILDSQSDKAQKTKAQQHG